MDNNLKVIDLFCGCGGLTLGFQNAGFDVVASFDNWNAAINVYGKNFKHDVINVDLDKLDGDYELLKKYNPDVIIGSPPCQDFSHAGKRNEELGRADLTLVFAKIVASMTPGFFVMENVDRALKSNRYKLAKEILKDSQYGLTEKILDASLYGIPQNRKRLFVIGELNGDDNSLDDLLDDNQVNIPVTVREYFTNVIGKSPDFEYYYRHPRTYQRRAIYSLDEPSATIRGVNRPVPPKYKIHPNDATQSIENVKPLTTLQRSYIQTFPKNFIFNGSKTDLEQMVGNAVPVKLAEHVAECILIYIGDKTHKRKKNPVQPELFASNPTS